MIGTNFAKSVYSSIIAANVATVIMISLGRGAYRPQLYGSCLCASDGTTMRNRSSHMPMQTVNDEITIPGIFRNFLMLRRMTGMTKLHTTIVQKSGEYEPFCVTRNVFTSVSALPYQTVSRSLNVK